MFTKTGTTIVGLKFNNGVVLCADTRSTSELVMDKNCKKLAFGCMMCIHMVLPIQFLIQLLDQVVCVQYQYLRMVIKK